MKKNTKKMPQKEYKSVAKLVTIAPTIEEIQADWKRSNRATKHSLVYAPKSITKVRITKRTPKLR